MTAMKIDKLGRMIGATVEERFWSKVDKTEDCWLWTGGTVHNGYGDFRVAGKHVRAHCFAYDLLVGPIPESQRIDHTCHRWHPDCRGGKECVHRRCVNPDHLRIAPSNKENQENRAGAQANSTTGIRGVYWDKGKKRWMAAVQHNGKFVFAGRFRTLEEAEAAVIAKRNELFTHNDADRIRDTPRR